MNTAKSQVLPAPPNMIRALLAGFDAIANHIGLIAFSLALDLFLWFGPQLKLRELLLSYINWTIDIATSQTPQMADLMQTNREAIAAIADQLNLVSLLRTLPIGIASLMAGRGPVVNPFGNPAGYEIQSVGILVGSWIILTLLGLLLGTSLFMLVGQAALQGKISWSGMFRNLIKLYSQVLLLSIFWFLLLIAVSVPLSCVLPFLLVGNGGLGRFAVLIYGAMLVWFLFPLVFSPFGIFVYMDNMWTSVLRGARLVRFTLPTTLLFILVLVVLSQGLDMLWNIPVDTSWFTVIGVIGHAFIATSLLAAVFFYYRDAGNYVQQRLLEINKLA